MIYLLKARNKNKEKVAEAFGRPWSHDQMTLHFYQVAPWWFKVSAGGQESSLSLLPHIIPHTYPTSCTGDWVSHDQVRVSHDQGACECLWTRMDESVCISVYLCSSCLGRQKCLLEHLTHTHTCMHMLTGFNCSRKCLQASGPCWTLHCAMCKWTIWSSFPLTGGSWDSACSACGIQIQEYLGLWFSRMQENLGHCFPRTLILKWNSLCCVSLVCKPLHIAVAISSESCA